MQTLNLQIRRLNPYSLGAEPVSEIVFADSQAGNPVPQPRRCVSGTEPLKQFFTDEMGQSAANTETLLRRVQEEHSVEIRNVVLRTPTKFRLE
jgi:hypothetical protein